MFLPYVIYLLLFLKLNIINLYVGHIIIGLIKIYTKINIYSNVRKFEDDRKKNEIIHNGKEKQMKLANDCHVVTS